MAVQTTRILIATDDDHDDKHVNRLLSRGHRQFDCTEVTSIDEALAACNANTFDCAIVDFCVPEKNSLVGLSILCKNYPLMPIILATGKEDEIIAADAIRRGAADYICKASVTPELLQHTVDAAMLKASFKRKQIEQQEALENFSHLLVHDLKAPTRSIKAFSRFLATDIKSGVTTNLMHNCLRIQQAVERMDMLIDTLHAYTQAGGKVTYQEVDMRGVVADVVSNLDAAIKERRARVTNDDLTSVYGNRPLLTQLLQNLISNSLKFCVSTVPTVHVSLADCSKSTCVVEVKDNGIGIPADLKCHLFEPFKRLHSREIYPGSGLGLATCKKIVERHHGNLWCESTEHEGSSFFFSLRKSEPTALNAEQ